MRNLQKCRNMMKLHHAEKMLIQLNHEHLKPSKPSYQNRVYFYQFNLGYQLLNNKNVE